VVDEHKAPRHPSSHDPDPLVDAYKAGIDRSLLRENLKLTPEERIRKLAAFVRFTARLRQAGRRLNER
jgi:hypothetical protein